MKYSRWTTAILGVAAFLALTAGFAVAPSSDAALTHAVDDIEYVLEGNYAVISGYTGTSSVVTIPSQVIINGEQYPVVSIRDNTNPFRDSACIKEFRVDPQNGYFSSSDGVLFNRTGTLLMAYPAGSDSTEYTIPAGVQSVSKYAFKSCVTLESVKFDSDLKKISDYAFSGCSSMRSVSMSPSLTSIGQYAFSYCTGLDNLVVPDSVTLIGIGTFQGCSSLKDVTLSGNLEEIQADVFRDCKSLNAISLPESVKSIYNNVFLGCTSLVHLNIVCKDLSNLSPTSFCIGTEGNEVECYINCSTPGFDPRDYTDSYTIIHFNEESFTLRIYSEGFLFATYSLMCGEPVDVELPERIGYSLSSWTDGSGNTVPFPDRMPATDLDLQAVWSPVQYRIIYHSNDGTDCSYYQLVTYDRETSLELGRYSQEHMCYTGWRDASDNHYDDGQYILNLSSGEDFHMYAEWTDPAFIIHYESQVGEGTMPDQPFLGGKNQAIYGNAYSAEGYVFFGWVDDKGNEYFDRQNVKDLGTDAVIITFTAKWQPIQYVVKFELQGGSGSAQNIIATYGETYSVPKNISRIGYVLLGWSQDPDTLEPELSANAQFTNLTDKDGKIVILYAIWCINVYTVFYDANGGIGEMDKQFVVFGDTPNLRKCTFTREYSTFVGWALEPNGVVTYADEAQLPGDIFPTNNSLYLYAIWVNNTYTIHFDANGGEGTMAALGAECNTDVQLPLCTFTSETSFKGWSLTPGGKIVYADGAVVNNLSKGASSVTLYASWVNPPEPPVGPVIGGDDLPVVAIAVGSLVLIAVVAGAVFIFRKYHA